MKRMNWTNTDVQSLADSHNTTKHPLLALLSSTRDQPETKRQQSTATLLRPV